MRIFAGRRPIPVNPGGIRVMKNEREPNELMRFRM